MPAPKCPLIAASRPPSMLAREFVGVTQASTRWSSIEPWTISTSGFSSKVARHALMIFGLMSTSTIFVDMASSRLGWLGSGRDLDHVLDALLTGIVDDVFV